MANLHFTIPLTCFVALALEYAARAQQEQGTAGSAQATIVEPISVSALDDLYLQQFTSSAGRNTNTAPRQRGTSQEASACFPMICAAGTAFLRVHSGERRGYQVSLPRSVAVRTPSRQSPLLVTVQRAADMKRPLLDDPGNEAADSSIIAIKGVIAKFSSAQAGRYNAFLPVLVIFE